MHVIRFGGERPGPGWHRHGTTAKTIPLQVSGRVVRFLLLKQRWLHKATGRTLHDRPFYDAPGFQFGFDIVVVGLAAWLVGSVGLHAVGWPWDDDGPSCRTVQRWAARLAELADDWLQTSRTRILDYVAPRPMEDLLPAGGIPPPEGARLRSSQGDVRQAWPLRDVVWLHEKAAQALSIPIRQLLGVARWRCPKNPASNDAS